MSSHVTAANASLRLEALAQRHLTALCDLLQPPGLAASAGLHQLADEKMAAEWLRAQCAEMDRNFAVMRGDDRMVGLTGYSRIRSAAMLQFLIGEPYQGCALSLPAAALTRQNAIDAGVVEFFAASHRDNARAHGTLVRLGLNPIQLGVALPPDDEVIFFAQSPGGFGAAQQKGMLEDICAALSSPLRFS